MAKNPLSQMAIATLRGGATHGTALTATDASILATDLLDARLESWRSGIFLLSVEAVDGGDADETYVVDLIGRDNSTDAYTTLASITVTRAVPGTYAVSVPQFKSQLNYALTAGGTTPSITFSAIAICTEQTYLPDLGTVITS